MKIHEYQGKEILRKYNVPVPRGKVAFTVDEAVKAAEEKGEKRGRKEEKIEIAKALKENGVDLTIIVKSSGLSKKEIEKL